MKELYRVCKPGAKITIIVPHPRHDDFLSDPTHVRAITPLGMKLFSKDVNRKLEKIGAANSPLGLYYDVDFEVKNVRYCLDSPWKEGLESRAMSNEQIDATIKKYNNVVKEMEIILEVVK
jgi:hypothetical protein